MLRSFNSPHHVSIHAPVRGATCAPAGSLSVPRSFNPRPRAGGDPIEIEVKVGPWGFNPRPRAGGDLNNPSVVEAILVSIHAPVRGATFILSWTILLPGVSIHAPVRGATAATLDSLMGLSVSIHAPVRGATAYL